MVSGLPSNAIRVPADSTRQLEGNQSGALAAEWVQLDSQRAQRLLGWRPRYDIMRSLRDMYDSVPPGAS